MPGHWYDYLDEREYRRFFEGRRFREATEPEREEPIEERAYERFREVERGLQPLTPEQEAAKREPRARGLERFREVQRGIEPALPTTAQMREHEYVNEVIEAYRRGEIAYEDLVDLIRGTAVRPGGIHGILGRYGPELGPYRGEGGLGERLAHVAAPFITPPTEYLPPEARRVVEAPLKAVEKIPLVGPKAAEFFRSLTSPAGLAATAVFPTVMARMAAYGAGLYGAGKVAEEAGVPVAETPIGRWGPAGILETVGVIGGPAAGPALERAAVRGIKQVPAAARAGVAQFERVFPKVGRVLIEERGGPRPTMRLTNDIRTPAMINKRLKELSKVEKMTAKQKREWNRLYAEKDLNEILRTGTVDDQMDNIIGDVLEMEQELELRAVAREVTPARAPKFGTAEREAWEAERLGRPRGERPSTRFSREPKDVLEERLKVFREFRDSMRVEPVGEEPTVGRLRFTEKGELVEEPTFATERELAGIREEQASLGIGAGERPIETVGPMFEGAAAGRAAREAADKAKAAYLEQFYQAERSGSLSAQAQEEFQKCLGWAKKQWPHTGLAEQRKMAIGRMYDSGVPLEGFAAPRPAPSAEAAAFRQATELRAGRAPTREEALARWRAGYEKLGVEPPREPPRKPPTAEAAPPTPPEDPVGKLTRLIRAAKPVRKETEALKHDVKRKQAAALGRIFERYPEEAPYRAKGVLKGELPTAAFEPPKVNLSEAEIGALRRRIRTFFEEQPGRQFAELDVRDALENMLAGKQPTWGEIGALQSVFGRGLGRALEAKMPPLKRVWREALQIWNLSKAFRATLDQSWHLRQGILVLPRHPFASIKGGWKGVQSLWRSQTHDDSIRFLTQGKQAGEISPNLFVARVGPEAAAVERAEPFISSYADLIPGIKQASREFATTGNFVRGYINCHMNRVWTQRLGRKLTAEEMDWTGRLVNWGTGRGPLPDEYREVLAAIFWAPGYRTAKPAYVSLLANPKTPGFVRRMVAEEIVAFVGTGTAVLSALKLSGVADVELDWRSSDFGKVKVGKMRADFWGGYQQLARVVGQLITGERKTLSTGEIMDVARQEVAGRYIESGEAPSMGLAIDLWSRETFEGLPVTWQEVLKRMLLPLAWEDIYEAVKEEGELGLIAAPLAHFGVGLWTPDLAGVRVDELTQKYDLEGRRKNEMATVEFEELAEQHPDLAEARETQVREAARRGRPWAEFVLEREEGDAEFEKGLKDALLDPKGRTYQQLSEELGDHFYEWAIRSDQFFGELDIDPRDDLDRRINAYYAIEMPAFPTEEERAAFFAQKEEMLRGDPELAEAIHDHQVFRFTDPDVRRFVDLKWQADLVANEYYSIPAKVGMSFEEQERAARNVAKAQAVASAQGIPFAVALFDMNLPTEEETEALIYHNLPDNPDRKLYRYDHPERWELFKTFYSDIPLGMVEQPEPEMAMAGVR